MDGTLPDSPKTPSPQTGGDKQTGRGQRGIALLTVLWLLVLLAVMAASFSDTARTRAHIARNLIDNSQARWLADAGARLAMLNLWRTALGKAQTPLNGTPIGCRLGTGVLWTSIQDEKGLIDLNAAPPWVLERLFEAEGTDIALARQLAAATVDYRDPDDLKQLNGAEADDYRHASLSHGPKNGPFRAVEELEQVLGITPDLFDRVRPALTVHSRKPMPDMTIAPLQVQRAVQNTDDDSTGGASPTSRPIRIASLASPARSIRRGVFALEVTAITASGGRFTRYAVVTVGGLKAGSHQILYWRQGKAGTALPAQADLPACE